MSVTKARISTTIHLKWAYGNPDLARTAFDNMFREFRDQAIYDYLAYNGYQFTVMATRLTDGTVNEDWRQDRAAMYASMFTAMEAFVEKYRSDNSSWVCKGMDEDRTTNLAKLTVPWFELDAME